MRQGRLLALLGSICLVLILTALPFVSACAQPAPAPVPAPAPAPAPAPSPAPTPAPSEPITFKVVSFLPEHVSHVNFLKMLIKKVNEQSKGELTIEYIGGPEVMGSFDQAKATKDGIIDMCWIAGGYYESIFPAAYAWQLSDLTSQEEREQGVYDFMNDLHEKIGLFYLGRGGAMGPGDRMHNIFTNVRVETPWDMYGLKIACTVGFERFEAMGLVPALILDAERYTAMERGTVDAFQKPVMVVASQHLYEVTKYAIDPPYFTDNVVTLVNLDKWNSLPKHLQDLMIDAEIAVEAQCQPIYHDLIQKARQTCMDGGMEFIKFTPADAKAWIKNMYDFDWTYLKEKDPVNAPILEEMMRR